jgi:glycosyltransferase involved in cell wall biosynthesis
MHMKILLELRAALDGHAGIPQETRLLFRGLSLLPGVEVDGLLQSSNRLLGKGLPPDERKMGASWTEDRRIDRLSRVVISLEGGGSVVPLQGVRRLLAQALAVAKMMVLALVGRSQVLTRFEPSHFKDFVWRALFARTLALEDFDAVTTARYRIARVPWSAVHFSALVTRKLGGALYPRLDTRGFDLMIAETPYPGRVANGTRLVIRYHDAIPLLMPHTISDRAHHQATHYHALRRNVRDGAWFACVSDATRRDLISVFPEAAERAVTIPNMVSHRYFREDSAPDRVVDVLQTRANARVHALAQAPRRIEPAPGRGIQYLLYVSTIEPRKNHLTLLAAWEQLRAHGHPDLHLVLVGMLGWHNKPIIKKLLPWIGRGQTHLLDDVPASDLRLLYRHANVTVCPSYGEGFGFSGVEAMCSGGVVAASDLPVHHEIYGNAAEYFNPYSADDMVRTLQSLLVDDASDQRQRLASNAQAIAARYLPDTVLPQWQSFLDEVAGTR